MKEHTHDTLDDSLNDLTYWMKINPKICSKEYFASHTHTKKILARDIPKLYSLKRQIRLHKLFLVVESCGKLELYNIQCVDVQGRRHDLLCGACRHVNLIFPCFISSSFHYFPIRIYVSSHNLSCFLQEWTLWKKSKYSEPTETTASCQSTTKITSSQTKNFGYHLVSTSP